MTTYPFDRLDQVRCSHFFERRSTLGSFCSAYANAETGDDTSFFSGTPNDSFFFEARMNDEDH